MLLAVYRSDGLAFKRFENLNIIRANKFARCMVVFADETGLFITGNGQHAEATAGHHWNTTRPIVARHPASLFALAQLVKLKVSAQTLRRHARESSGRGQ